MRKLISIPGAMAAIVALTLGLALTPLASAQGTPVDVSAPEDDAVTQIDLRPAHIHAGTCDDVGEVVYPLNDLQAAASIADPDATPPLDLGATPDAAEALGLFDIVAQSGTEVDASIEELLDGDYVVNVHESAENIDNYIACGEIDGDVVDGDLFIELFEVGNSGFGGRAEFSDGGNGTTIVNVSLFPTGATGTPEATPAS